MHQNSWRLGLCSRPHKMSSPRSTQCWRGWRWWEKWICLQSQFLDYATVGNLNRTKSFFKKNLKCTIIVGGWGSAPDPVAELTTFYTLFDRMEMRGISICFQSQFLDSATMVNLNRTKNFIFVLKCTKIAGGWGSAQDPTSWAHHVQQTVG